MKIFLRDFKVNAGREDILKQIIGNVSLHEANNDNRVREVNFSTLKNLLVNSTNLQTATFINTVGILLMVSHIIRYIMPS